MVTLKVPKIKTPLDLGIFLFSIKAGYDLSAIFSPYIYIDYAVIGVGLTSFIITILRQGYSGATLVKYTVITLASLFSTMLSGQSAIIVTVITILSIRQINISKVIETIRKWSVFFLCIHSICFGVLLFFNQTQLFLIDAQGRMRASFGFVHANAFSVYVFNIILMWIWEHYESIKSKHIMIIFLVETIIYAFTNSKTFYICAVFFCILLLIVKRKKERFNWIHVFAKLSVPVCALCFFILFRNWKNGNALIYLLDEALTGRIKLGAYSFINFGLTLMGQKLNYGVLTWTPEWGLNHFTLDCTYSSLMMNIGCLWLVIIVIGFIKLAKFNNVRISIFIIIWSLYAITEVHGLNAYLCFPILLLSILLSDKTIRTSVPQNVKGIY